MHTDPNTVVTGLNARCMGVTRLHPASKFDRDMVFKVQPNKLRGTGDRQHRGEHTRCQRSQSSRTAEDLLDRRIAKHAANGWFAERRKDYNGLLCDDTINGRESIGGSMSKSLEEWIQFSQGQRVSVGINVAGPDAHIGR